MISDTEQRFERSGACQQHREITHADSMVRATAHRCHLLDGDAGALSDFTSSSTVDVRGQGSASGSESRRRVRALAKMATMTRSLLEGDVCAAWDWAVAPGDELAQTGARHARRLANPGV